MQRVPLRDIGQAETMSCQQSLGSEQSEKSVITVATKLLNSARKSAVKKCAKRTKLSLQKEKLSSNEMSKQSSVKTLKFNDMSESEEFKASASLKIVHQAQPVTRKRKKTSMDDNEDDKVKSTKRKASDSLFANSDRHGSGQPNDRNTNSSVLEAHGVSGQVPCEGKISETENASRSSRSHNHTSPNSKTLRKEKEECSTREGTSSHHSPSSKMRGKETAKISELEHASRNRTRNHSSNAGEKEETKICEEKGGSACICPVCGKSQPSEGFAGHVLHCQETERAGVDRRQELQDYNDRLTDDSEFARKSTPADRVEEGVLSVEYAFCQVCQKNISHLNSHRRRLHVNSCIDKEEKQKEDMEEMQRALEAAKTQVLDCPMCGKVLRTILSRKSHLKKCASGLGVAPDQLLAAVKRQEEEHAATLAAGILPSSSRLRSRQNSTTSHKGLASLPKSKLDEDTQLALALSSSLQKDGEEPGPTPAAPARRKRKHDKQESDFLLLKLMPNQAAGRIESRVSDLLTRQAEEEEETVPALPKVSQQLLQGPVLQAVRWSADEQSALTKMFWGLSSLEECSGTSSLDNCQERSLPFYVSALMPPVQVSSVAAGSKLCSLSDIPGRRRSLDVEAETPVEPSDHLDNQCEVDSGLPFSTQTAALLADMAAEADGMDVSQSSPQSQSSVHEIEQQVHQELLTAFSGLVNEQRFSDVNILAAESSILYAHKAILSVRCPPLLKLAEKGSGRVDLTDSPQQCVLAVLRYLYTGLVEVRPCFLSHTLQLADRFGLATFSDICRRRLEMVVLQPELNHQTQQTVETEHTGVVMVSSHRMSFATAKDRKSATAGDRQIQSGGSVTSGCGFEKCRESEFVRNCHPSEEAAGAAPRMKRSSSQPYTSLHKMKKHRSPTQSQDMECRRPISPHRMKNRSLTQSQTREYTSPHKNKEDHSLTQSQTNENNSTHKNKKNHSPTGSQDMKYISPHKRKGHSSTQSKSRNYISPHRRKEGHSQTQSQTNENTSLHKNKKNRSPTQSIDSPHKTERKKDNSPTQSQTKKYTSLYKFQEEKAILSYKQYEPASSFVASDEDLFKSDDSDVPSPPTVSKIDHTVCSSQDRSRQECPPSKLDSIRPCSKSVGGRDNEHRKDTVSCSFLSLQNISSAPTDRSHNLEDSSRGVEIHERMRAPDTSVCSGQPSVFDDSLPSVNVSHVDVSCMQNRHCRTSVSFESTREGQAQNSVSIESEKVDLLSQPSEELALDFVSNCPSPAPIKKLDRKGFPSQHSTAGNDKVELSDSTSCEPEEGQSPFVSVVEHDSLYITPYSKVRKTFQLVTPVTNTQTALPSLETPHAAVEKPQLQPSLTMTRDYCADADLDRSQFIQGADGEVIHLEPKDSSRCEKPEDCQDAINGETDNDSDLEIVEPSFSNVASPTFSIQSMASCSQSQTLSQETMPPSHSHIVVLSPPMVGSQLGRDTGTQSLVTAPAEGQKDCVVDLCSPAKSASKDGCATQNPIKHTTPSRFSSYSEDSDGEMMRPTELMSDHVPGNVDHSLVHSIPSRQEDSEALSEHGQDMALQQEEDVWDGFDDLDLHNQDFGLMQCDPDTDLGVLTMDDGNSKTLSQHASPRTVFKSPLDFSPLPSASPGCDTPIKSPKLAKDESVKQSSKKHSNSKSVSSTADSQSRSSLGQSSFQKQCCDEPVRGDSTPVRFRSSGVRPSLDRREWCRDTTDSADHNSPPSAELVMVDEAEAANSSFLWLEENAPLEENELAGLQETEPELRRKDLEKDRQKPVLQTPTMTKSTKKGGKSAWIPPSPFTPMPAYDDMATPDLKHEVQKFGLKPVGKKRMKLVLKDIYIQTHQYETDSDCEELPSGQGLPTEGRESNTGESAPEPISRNGRGPKPPTGKSVLTSVSSTHTMSRRAQKKPTSSRQPAGTQKTLTQAPGLCKGSGLGKKPERRPKAKRTLAGKAEGLSAPSSSQSPSKRKEGGGDGKEKAVTNRSPVKSTTPYCSSPEKGCVSSSQDSDFSDRPDVSVLEDGRVDSDDEDITPSQQVAAKDLPQKLMAFFQSHSDLYQKVLMYEPLDLGVLKDNLKAAGIKCSQDKLLDFLDEKCITFTTKNVVPNRRQKGPRKKPQARKPAASQE